MANAGTSPGDDGDLAGKAHGGFPLFLAQAGGTLAYIQAASVVTKASVRLTGKR
jgi:hypothetical protein